ncbi:hypothetical protein [Lysinibacillus sp. fls2-241-R2A-57]|uniref:hypothetical protein n=1 Tax=Lysinibacillus sp. fls2-241-R2A-57 TaxID=3040292 RepID=UPI0025555EB9|nr:hypothetical protein [Lysinibacillus sp. fls2-241-R2A-57]
MFARFLLCFHILKQLFYLCESVATATNVLSARKQSDSDNCFICAKAKRQRQMFSVAKA